MKTNKVKITESNLNQFPGKPGIDIEKALSEEELENVAGGKAGPQPTNIDPRVHGADSDPKNEPHPLYKGVMGS